MQSGWIEIFFLAMLAGFIGLRLYHVLGRRTGHEKPVADPFRPATPDIARPSARVRAASEPPVSLEVPADVAPEVRPGLEAIHAIDKGFSPEHFLTGAQGAYAMVLEAFWEGDEEALRDLASDEMLLNFRAALDARQASGQRLENRLIHVDRAQIVGAEALIRWHQPDHGWIYPSAFIPVAEDSGLIVPLSQWVLRQACEQARAWQVAGLPPICISVNISARSSNHISSMPA